ncbi:HAMP domain-containing histidine kinase [Candidatus Kaiserbacteria bacterium]|nr:HAMP domain-containing histidine kinase [Candidatus Kaiserbacteria bacterium]
MDFIPTAWLERLSVRGKLSIIIGLIVFLLLFGFAEFTFGMKVMSGIRAYVGGEGLWSKAQKAAVNDLTRYSESFDEADYQSFLVLLHVPLGDKQARLELDKDRCDINVVHEGFLAGGNNKEDLDDMVFLYRRFRFVSYMDSAIRTWTEGDAEIERLLTVAARMHAVVSASHGPLDQIALQPQIVPLMEQIHTIDQKLTVLENRFSATLGEGSRFIRDLLFWVTLVGTLVFGTLALLIVLFIRKMIIQVDAAKSEFVSLASHQLRTPATNMKWFLEMIIGGDAGPLNAKQKEYFEEVSENNQRMISLVNMLLNIARIELGTFKQSTEQIQITELIKEALKEYRTLIGFKSLTIHEVYAPDLPVSQIDPRLWSVVLQNVISNAVKYTPSGGTVTIGVSFKEKNETFGGRIMRDDSIIVVITDTGYGIPKDQQDKVFTRLFRGDNVKEKDTDGTGLGLYLVKLILDHLRGDVWFESEENHGSTFYLVVPVSGSIRKKK